MGGYPGLSRGPNHNRPSKREAGGSEPVTMDCDNGSRRKSGRCCTAGPRVEEGARNQGTVASRKFKKGKETYSPLEPPKGQLC